MRAPEPQHTKHHSNQISQPQRCGDAERSTGAAERVAERNGAAIDVHLFHVQTEVFAGHDGLRRERFVEFEQTDVSDGQASELQRRGNGERRANAHHLRRHTRHGVTDTTNTTPPHAKQASEQVTGEPSSGERGKNRPAEHAQNRQTEFFGLFAGHEQSGGGAVRHLRRSAGGRGAGFVKRRRQFAQACESGVGANAVVLCEHHVLHSAALLILHACGHRHNFVLEFTGLLRRRRFGVRRHSERVLLRAGDFVLHNTTKHTISFNIRENRAGKENAVRDGVRATFFDTFSLVIPIGSRQALA